MPVIPLKTLILLSVFCLWANSLPARNPKGFENERSKLKVVVIDPGHGGFDPGATVSGAVEKDIVLDIGLKVGRLIKKNFPDIKVIYTRDNDVFVPLNKRAELANKNKADLFISIHANYVGAGSVLGTETFVLGQHRSQENLEIAKKENAVILLEDDYTTTYEGFDPNSSESYIMFELVQDEYLGQSLQFAANIQQKFKEVAKRADRGVKQAGFLVLRQAAMPSVLIETGFITNANDKKYLTNEAGRENLALSIFKAFSEYKSSVEDKSRFSLASANPENGKPAPAAKPENTPSSNKNQVENNPLPEKGTIQNPIDSGVNKGKAKPEAVESKPETPGASKRIQEEEKAKEAEPKSKSSKSIEIQKESVLFTVQIASSLREVSLVPANFKGEKNIHLKISGGRYRYYSGKFDNYRLAEAEKNRLKQKFNDAFVVAFEGEKQIVITDPLKEGK